MQLNSAEKLFSSSLNFMEMNAISVDSAKERFLAYKGTLYLRR